MRRILQLAVVLGLAAQTAVAGIFYRAVNQTDGNQASAATNWQVVGWVDGDNARIELQSSGSPLMPEGSYLLTQDGGRNVYLVDEAQGTYSRWDLEAILGAAGSVLGSMGSVLSVELANLSVEKLGEESAGAVLGLPSVRYKYRTTYDMKLKVLGMKRENRVEIAQEVLATDAISDSGFGVWLRKEPPSLGNASFDELVRAEMSKIVGFPLKMVTVTTTTAAKGKATTQTSTMEVMELREEAIGPETFILDPSLVEQPMPIMGTAGEEQGGLRGLLGSDGN